MPALGASHLVTELRRCGPLSEHLMHLYVLILFFERARRRQHPAAAQK
jgi:hypothetical protein